MEFAIEVNDMQSHANIDWYYNWTAFMDSHFTLHSSHKSSYPIEQLDFLASKTMNKNKKKMEIALFFIACDCNFYIFKSTYT